MNPKRIAFWNALAAVMFVLLLIVHLLMRKNMLDWAENFPAFLVNLSICVVRPLLAFFTGYTLFASLFSLLKARLEVAGLRRWNTLRIIMLAVTLLFAAAIVFVLISINFATELINYRLYMVCYRICFAQWLWLLLGVYWFLSLNALRVTEFEPLDGSFDEE